MTHESHEPGGPAWLDTHFFNWARFICREGVNRFETFDFESLRWLQLHVHDAAGRVLMREVGVRRRIYPGPGRRASPAPSRAPAPLRRVGQHARQRGPGDVRRRHGPRAPAVQRRRRPSAPRDPPRLGDRRLARRFLRTFSEGMTLDGYFLDCWPAFDRLARITQRQVGATAWGPLLDHGVSFDFDCWHHYLETGETDSSAIPTRASSASPTTSSRGAARTACCRSRAWACPRCGSTTASPGRATSSARSTCTPRRC